MFGSTGMIRKCWCLIVVVLVVCLFRCEAQTTNCGALSIEECAKAADCQVFETSANRQGCRTGSTEDECDVQLDYSISEPFGCPESCKLTTLSSGVQLCEQITFWENFSQIYWGLQSLPFGYLFWNLLLGLTVILIARLAPTLVAWVVCKIINHAILKKPGKHDPQSAAIRIKSLRIALNGGRITFEEFEYASSNVHLRIVEGGFSVLWWLSSESILRDASSLTVDGSKGPGSSTSSQTDTFASGSTEDRSSVPKPGARYTKGSSKPVNQKDDNQYNEANKKTFGSGGISFFGRQNSGSLKSEAKSQERLPFRLSAFFSGVELSIFNNTERFTDIEKSIKRLFEAKTKSTRSSTVSPSDLDQMESGTRATNHRNQQSTSNSSNGEEVATAHNSIWRKIRGCFVQLARLCSCRKLGRRVKKKLSTSRPVATLSTHEEGVDSSDSDGENYASQRNPPKEVLSDIGETDLHSTPWFYKVFPISKVEFSQTCIYIADPSLETTCIIHARKGFGVHYLEPLSESMANFDLDKYRLANKLIWNGVRVKLVKNEQFVGEDTLAFAQVQSVSAHEDFLENSKRAVVGFFRDLFEISIPTDVRMKHKLSSGGNASDMGHEYDYEYEDDQESDPGIGKSNGEFRHRTRDSLNAKSNSDRFTSLVGRTNKVHHSGDENYNSSQENRPMKQRRSSLDGFMGPIRKLVSSRLKTEDSPEPQSPTGSLSDQDGVVGHADSLRSSHAEYGRDHSLSSASSLFRPQTAFHVAAQAHHLSQLEMYQEEQQQTSQPRSKTAQQQNQNQASSSNGQQAAFKTTKRSGGRRKGQNPRHKPPPGEPLENNKANKPAETSLRKQACGNKPCGNNGNYGNN